MTVSTRTKVKPPRSLSATVSLTNGFAVSLHWTPIESGAPRSYFVVYRDDEELTSGLTLSSFRDATVLGGVLHDYRVSSVLVTEMESPASDPSYVTVPGYPVWESGWSVTLSANSHQSVSARASDPLGTSLTFSRAGGTAPAQVTVNSSGDVLNTSAAGGSYTVIIRADNGSLYSDVTVSITIAATNQPPVFDTAPTTASVSSTGGTVQFSASDPEGLSVSYGVSGLGSSINSSGLASIPSGASGGKMVVYASDGSLTTSITCVVTVAQSGSISWNPGYYVQTSGNMDWPETNDIDNVVEFASTARSYIKGVNIRPFWRIVEPTRDNYDWEIVDYALDNLAPGKKLWFQLPWARFNTGTTYGGVPSGSMILPSYLLTSEFGDGVLRQFKPTNPISISNPLNSSTLGKWDIDTKIWNTAVRDRYLALAAAFYANYQNDDRIGGFVVSELIFGSLNSGVILAPGDTANFNGQTFVVSTRDVMIPGIRDRIGNMGFMLYMNFISDTSDFSTDSGDKFVEIRDAVVSAKGIISGPDTDPAIGGKKGLQYARGVLPTTSSLRRDCRGLSGIGCGLQTRDLNGTNEFSPGWTGAQYAQWMYGTQQATHVFMIIANTSVKFNGLMTYAAANPNLIVRTGTPSGFV